MAKIDEKDFKGGIVTIALTLALMLLFMFAVLAILFGELSSIAQAEGSTAEMIQSMLFSNLITSTLITFLIIISIFSLIMFSGTISRWELAAYVSLLLTTLLESVKSGQFSIEAIILISIFYAIALAIYKFILE